MVDKRELEKIYMILVAEKKVHSMEMEKLEDKLEKLEKQMGLTNLENMALRVNTQRLVGLSRK